MYTRPLIDRLFDKLHITVDGCWNWTASTDTTGYGRIRVDGQLRPAHRVTYEMFVGSIPEGLYLDHLCRNRGCARPDHLEPVTMEENFRRGPDSAPAKRAKQTHCIHGHELSGYNLIIRRGGGRACRACNNEAGRRYRKKAA